MEPKRENLKMKKGNKVVGTRWTHMQEEHSWGATEKWWSMIHQGINMSGWYLLVQTQALRVTDSRGMNLIPAATDKSDFPL